MLNGSNSLPVFEATSAKHTASFIGMLLEQFMEDVRKLNGKRNCYPVTVVTDFSFALIHAVNTALNKMSIQDYLTEVFATTDTNKKRRITRLCICKAHLMKAVASRVVRVERKLSIRRAVLVAFSSLQDCQTLEVPF